jgi:trehalose 6-phosphate synthase/phosphatase
VYQAEYWTHYRQVNEAFCAAVLEIARPRDTIWVHDYHLMLLPALLREHLPEARIGFFLHIPFPSYELFRIMPRAWGAAILHGLLGADLVGFHAHSYTQYFLRSALRMLGYDHHMGLIQTADRLVKADTFPMGIDFAAFHAAATAPEVAAIRPGPEGTAARPRPDAKVVLSIDRLDYTKGIPHRLEAFEIFLEKYPAWHNRVTLALVLVPSRIDIEHYQQTKQRIDGLVGHINGRFGNLGWVPVVYQYRALDFPHLVALYTACDVALITPLRDGMNLIAKEYIASRVDGTGVLILSELAGAATELGEALLINPNQREEMADALKEALELPVADQVARNRRMQARLKRYDVQAWARDFLHILHTTKAKQIQRGADLLHPPLKQQLLADFRQARRRLLLLDYEGTLVPLPADPQDAAPSSTVLFLLSALAADHGTEVIIMSGSDPATLDRWFGGLLLGHIATDGAWVKHGANGWQLTRPLSAEWKPTLRAILELHVDRLPGSFVTEQDYALEWHYTAVDPDLGAIRAAELMEDLVGYTANLDVQITHSRGVIMIKSAGISKGIAALPWVSRFDFVLAAGNDSMDEELFRLLPDASYTIRVNGWLAASRARFRLRTPDELRQLLAELTR